jgi:hypothetical protein
MLLLLHWSKFSAKNFLKERKNPIHFFHHTYTNILPTIIFGPLGQIFGRLQKEIIDCETEKTESVWHFHAQSKTMNS